MNSHHIKSVFPPTSSTTPPCDYFYANLRATWDIPKLDKSPIPNTHSWTFEELKYFNLHYFQVKDHEKWATVFCPDVPLTPRAKALSEFPMGFEELSIGMRMLYF